MNNIPILLLFIYAAFTVNLLLQCGLGIKGAVESDMGGQGGSIDILELIKSGIIFLAVILLWFFFSKVVFSLFQGIYLYVLIFPVSFIAYEAMEYFVFNHILKKPNTSERFIDFPGGITAVAVFLCINLANTFLETIVLSLGVSSGIFFVKLIIREIRRRAALETVPVFLRGKPLVLITMGMLSLVFTTVSLLLFRMIGAG